MCRTINWIWKNIIEPTQDIEFNEDNEPTNDFINELDIFHQAKPNNEIMNGSYVVCASCKKHVKAYNTWNTVKKCFECKECNNPLYSCSKLHF